MPKIYLFAWPSKLLSGFLLFSEISLTKRSLLMEIPLWNPSNGQFGLASSADCPVKIPFFAYKPQSGEKWIHPTLLEPNFVWIAGRAFFGLPETNCVWKQTVWKQSAVFLSLLEDLQDLQCKWEKLDFWRVFLGQSSQSSTWNKPVGSAVTPCSLQVIRV